MLRNHEGDNRDGHCKKSKLEKFACVRQKNICLWRKNDFALEGKILSVSLHSLLYWSAFCKNPVTFDQSYIIIKISHKKFE